VFEGKTIRLLARESGNLSSGHQEKLVKVKKDELSPFGIGTVELVIRNKKSPNSNSLLGQEEGLLLKGF